MIEFGIALVFFAFLVFIPAYAISRTVYLLTHDKPQSLPQNLPANSNSNHWHETIRK